MEEIKRALKAQGMNDQEIARYMAKFKDPDDRSKSDLESGVTKTQLRTRDVINHDDLSFDLGNNPSKRDQTIIEIDESALRQSTKSDHIVGKKKHETVRLQGATPAVASARKGIQTDDILHKNSTV